MLMQREKHRTSKGRMELPQKVKNYSDDWCLGDLYDGPMDWSKQRDPYNEK
jgi:hypothetical protein